MKANNEIQNEFIRKQFLQRENEISHPTYNDELAFYDLIKSGDVKTLRETNNIYTTNDEKRGVLSKDPIRNLRYHQIASITMITRFCIEGGLPEQEAYGLSDMYINQLDVADSMDKLYKIQETLIFDFANRMKKVQKQAALSVYTRQALDYVYDNLHKPMTVSQIAKAIGVHESYLSKLFSKEMGQSLSAYIRHKRIQTAQYMLVYSDFTCAEIAQYLAFSSSSHFTSIFRQDVGISPLKYRKQHYRRHWDE